MFGSSIGWAVLNLVVADDTDYGANDVVSPCISPLYAALCGGAQHKVGVSWS